MIDRLASIGATVTIGPKTEVWQFATVIRYARIGSECTIGSCAIVDGAKVGDRCSIGHGAQVHPGTVIGSDVFVGPGAIICNDRWPRVGKDGFDIDALLSGKVTTVVIRDGVSIGAGAIILPGVQIGEHSVIAAGAVVQESVPPFHLHKRNGEVVHLVARKPERMPEAACFG